MRLGFAVLGGFLFLAACSGGGGGQATTPVTPQAALTADPAAMAPAAAGTEGLLHQAAVPAPVASPKIQHVIIIVQENRTPDNLFQGLPGADIATTGQDTHGNTIPLQPIPLANTYDLGHAHKWFPIDFDGGKMDGFNNSWVSCGTSCPYKNPAYGYVPSSDNAPYMAMAQQYTFADRMFSTQQGPSFPAHQYLISGTAEPSVGSTLLAAENPTLNGIATKDAGCTAPASTLVQMIDPSGNENTTMYPCFDHPVLMDLLDTKHVSWSYYTSTLALWIGVNAISHIRNGPDWVHVIQPPKQILSDIPAGKLPQVSWVIPTDANSDHPRGNTGGGPAWVASIVNAIGTSSYWQNTAIFVVWDDWGGWYDHVPPPQPFFNSFELGFRVPLIVISPYAKPKYVSHVTHEFGSILKFIENHFTLGSLGYTDARADNLSDCFNFQQAPIVFQPIAAKFNRQYFLTQPQSTEPPDDM